MGAHARAMEAGATRGGRNGGVVVMQGGRRGGEGGSGRVAVAGWVMGGPPCRGRDQWGRTENSTVRFDSVLPSAEAGDNGLRRRSDWSTTTPAPVDLGIEPGPMLLSVSFGSAPEGFSSDNFVFY